MDERGDNLPGVTNVGINSLLHIPVAKQKASARDTPLEKETRKFNKLVEEIAKMEDEAKKYKAAEDMYQDLFRIKVLPLVVEIAATQMDFIRKIERIFHSGKFSITEASLYLEFCIPILIGASHHIADAAEKLEEYFKWQNSISPKKHLRDFISQEQPDDDYVTGEPAFEDGHKMQPRGKASDPENKSISELYKQLAKQIHPDLEQEESKKVLKEQLMKDLIFAKDKEDIHAMLLIQQAAIRINDTTGHITSYSLNLLKKYNASLKKKLALLASEAWSRKVRTYAFEEVKPESGRKVNPTEKRIKNDIRNLKEIRETLEINTRTLKTVKQLKELLSTY